MSWKRCWNHNSSNSFYYDANDDQIVPDIDRHRHLHHNSKTSTVALSNASNVSSASNTTARLTAQSSSMTAADLTPSRSRQGSKS